MVDPTSTSLGVAQYAGEAITLFNNMKTPASILGGAIVGLGFGSPLPVNTPEGVEESTLEKILRKSYLLAAAVSLLSQLIAIMWATIAVNKLTECTVAPAESVWHLLQRDYDMSWSGVNSHFMLGMLSFSYLIGVRSYFMAGRGMLGQSVAGLSLSALLFMVGIVNRGIAAGGGGGQSYGGSILSLFRHYIGLCLAKNASFGQLRPLEVGAIFMAAAALFQGVRAVRQGILSESNPTTNEVTSNGSAKPKVA